jgi:putative heme-binding domain-containing protein
MRDVPAAKSVPVLVKLAQQFDGKDRAYLEALGLGSTGKEREVYAAIAKAMGGPAGQWSDAFAGLAWRLHPAEAAADFKTRALLPNLSAEQRKLMLTALAFTKSREAAGAMMTLANTRDFPMKDLAQWWLLNRKGNDWQAFDVDAGMKALGLYDPDKVQLTSVALPPEPANAPKLPSPAEIAKIPGDAQRGATAIGACYACHRVGKNGQDFGPDLTTFGQQQPSEVIIAAIVNPSADISHGFEGSEVKTTDGLSIAGMVLSDGDPVIVKSMGGLLQTVPRSRIASITRLEKSLMFAPSALGLTPQSIADIVAYLKK